MLSNALLSLMNQESALTPVPAVDVITAMGNATVLGLILTFGTFFSGRYLDRTVLGENNSSNEDLLKDIVGAHNLLFISVGICGVMLLISNSLLRAFAIVAAITIVRFRVKLDNKTLGSAMLFAILAGMACGAKELTIAYVSVGIFLLLIIVLFFTVKLLRKGSP